MCESDEHRESVWLISTSERKKPFSGFYAAEEQIQRRKKTNSQNVRFNVVKVESVPL